MFRNLWVVCVSLLLTLSLIGCGGETEDASSSSAAPKSITIWWAEWAPATGLAELGEEFTKQTGTRVIVHQIPWANYQDQVFLNFGNSKTDFDIVVGDSQWIGRGAERGLYLDLTDWLPGAVDLKSIHPNAIRYLCEYPTGSGKYFGAPCETDAVGFAYRKDWFEDATEKAAFQAKFGRALVVPNTWDEFKQVAEFFTRPDQKRYGCAILTGRGYDSLLMGWQQMMWAWGGSWGDPQTFVASGKVNSPESAQSLQFLKDLMSFAPPGGVNLDYGGTLESFTNGSTAMSMNYFAFFPGIVKEMGDKAGFFVVPTHNGKRFVSLGGQGFSISTKIPAPQQELAKQFIAWFLKREQQEKWITKPAGFTANLDVLKSDAFRAAAPYNGPFADSLDAMQDFWNVPVYNELLSAAQQRVGEALDGKQTPQASLDLLATEHDRILKDAGLAK